MENLNVITADYEETGGGCYTYYGQLSNEQYFSFGLNVFAIFDADFGYLLTDEGFEETEGDWTDWINAHQITEYEYPIKNRQYPEKLIEETFELLKIKYPGRDEWHLLMREELGIGE